MNGKENFNRCRHADRLLPEPPDKPRVQLCSKEDCPYDISQMGFGGYFCTVAKYQAAAKEKEAEVISAH